MWPLLIASVLACDDAPPARHVVTEAPQWNTQRSREAGDLEAQLESLMRSHDEDLTVYLAFGATVDLDLYVTGPMQETVYYANTPSRIGGELLEDRRCEHSGPRIESVRFPRVSGRYRVGVDYPHACGDTQAPVPFVLRVETPGHRRSIRGLAVHQVFEPRVLEFELDPEGKP